LPGYFPCCLLPVPSCQEPEADKAKIVKEFCQKNQIILVYLPPYSPNLNPREFVWKDLKKKLSQYYLEKIENLKVIGQEITASLLELRQSTYTAKWREKFWEFSKRITID